MTGGGLYDRFFWLRGSSLRGLRRTLPLVGCLFIISACGDSTADAEPSEEGPGDGDGHGDGDRNTKPGGDGDGDNTPGDGDSTPPGDGDGDNTPGDGDSTPPGGDGDGDNTPGDGDGGNTPIGCESGTFDHDGDPKTACVGWAAACEPGHRETQAPTSTRDRVCSACNAGEYCAGGTAQAVSCDSASWDDDQDPSTACVAKTTCSAGQYVSVAGDARTDRACSECASGDFSTGPNAAQCQPWATCQPGTSIASAGSTTQNRTCSPCTLGQYTDEPNQSSCQNWSCLGKTFAVADGTTTRNQVCWTAKAESLSLGSEHACAVFSNGKAACWGDSVCSQAGKPLAGANDRIPRPVWIELPEGEKATSVAVDADSSCALTEDGHVYCWGVSAELTGDATRCRADLSAPKRLEFGDATGTTYAIKLEQLVSQRSRAGTAPYAQAYCGVEAAGAGTSLDKVWCWGSISFVDSGWSAARLMVRPNGSEGEPITNMPNPFAVHSLEMREGGVFFIGNENQLYRLVEKGSAAESRLQIAHVKDGMIAYGSGTYPILHFTRTSKTQYLVYEQGGQQKLAYWGDAGPQHTAPTTINSPLANATWVGMTSAGETAYAYTARAIYRWVPATDSAGTTSALLTSVPDAISQFRTSGTSHCFVSERGAIYCWGSNDKGQLGDGTTNGRAAPTLISYPTTQSN